VEESGSFLAHAVQAAAGTSTQTGLDCSVLVPAWVKAALGPSPRPSGFQPLDTAACVDRHIHVLVYQRESSNASRNCESLPSGFSASR